MTTYPYVAARFDYGLRKATLGLCFHGAEAEAGVVGYLSRDPARGVSANFVCEASGRMVRMLPFTHASGSMNPTDRSTNKAYFGHDYLVDVLGDRWTDPNSAVISVEIEMYANQGPNIKQVAALIAWSKDMKARFPSLRGAIGHADQTDTKRCPGTTSNMQLVFASIGGHGLWQEEPVIAFQFRDDQPEVTLSFPPGGSPAILRLDTGKLTRIDPIIFPPRRARPAVLAEPLPGTGDRRTGYVFNAGPATAFALATDVTTKPLNDCANLVAAAREKDRTSMLAKVAEVYP